MKNALVYLLLLLSHAALATHLLGGYIQVQKGTSSQQYTISVLLFMDEVNGQLAAQQTTSVQVCFGDGSSGTAQRTERTMLSSDPAIGRSVSRNVYTVSHAYAGPGTYTALCLVSNRTDGLLTIPVTGETPLGLSTTFSTNLPNNTPTLPPDNSFAGFTFQKLTLPFQATDAEGDSLIYTLSKPQTAVTTSCVPLLSDVDHYVFPNDITQRGTFRIDGRSGQLTWDAPTQVGRFNFAITVQEWRQGVLLSQTHYEQIVLVIDRSGGTPGTIPPYEPAQLSGEGIITGVTNPETNSDVSLLVTPIPTHDQLRVALALYQPSAVTLQLVDLNGRVVREIQPDTQTQRYDRTLDVRALSAGVYLLKARVDGRTITKKVLIH